MEIDIRKVKTLLLKILGNEITSFIQALRFVYLLKTKKSFDPEIILLNKFLLKGDIAIDIGANGADWTYSLYKVVSDSGSIYAFEADPYYAKATELAIKMMKMKNVFLIPFGLSDKIEVLPLRVKNTDGLRYSGRGFIDRSAKNKDINTLMVNLKPLDSMLDIYPQLINTKLIKCDVEGYELFVFKGSVEILNKARPTIILEVGNFEKHNYNGRILYKFFNEINYTAFTLLNNNKLSETNESLEHRNAISVNRILLPNENLKLYEYMFH